MRNDGTRRDKHGHRTIREKVDAELRSQLIRIQEGPAPSERWHNVRRGRVRPFGTITRVLEDARAQGYDRERIKGAILSTLAHAVDLVFSDEPQRVA